MTKSYLNALYEEGTRNDLFQWVCKLDAENDRLRDALREMLAAHSNENIGVGASMRRIKAKERARAALTRANGD
jgi:hypothetical protein